MYFGSPTGKRKRAVMTKSKKMSKHPHSIPREWYYNDEFNIPEDEMFSSLFHEIRTSVPEMAIFWACALDRKGLGEKLWKNLIIFSFRDIGYAYPEASCFIYTYFKSWMEEMKRYKRELRIRLEYGCTKALILMLKEKNDTKNMHESVSLILNSDFIMSYIENGIDSIKDKEIAVVLLNNIISYMNETPKALLPKYENECSCKVLKNRLQMLFKQNDPNIMKQDFKCEIEKISHLTTARHLIINVVSYLCILPKSTLARDMSYFTTLKCIGMLTQNDWKITISFPELEQQIYAIRKDKPQSVQQACICLCASIINRDERRAIEITDLFNVWHEEELFWDSLEILTHVFPVNYQWIHGFLVEYRNSWDFVKEGSEYFEGSRPPMFAAIALFVRGPPQRDVNDGVVGPANISYSKDYATLYYGTRTPTFASLEFIKDQDEDTDKNKDESMHRISNIFSSCFENKRELDTNKLLENKEMVLIAKLINKMVHEFPGSPSSKIEPYAVRTKKDSLVCKHRDEQHSFDVPNKNNSLSISRMSSTTQTKKKKRIKNATKMQSNEIVINDFAIDWSTKRGRKLGRGAKHAFVFSEKESRKSMIVNQYSSDIYELLLKQCKIAREAVSENNKAAQLYISHQNYVPNNNEIMNIQNTFVSSCSEFDFSIPIKEYRTCKENWNSISLSKQDKNYISVLKQRAKTLEAFLDHFKMNPWYDPGIMITYREIGSDLKQIQDEISSFYGVVDMFPTTFLLNIFDINEAKHQKNVEFSGSDKWLKILFEHNKNKTKSDASNNNMKKQNPTSEIDTDSEDMYEESSELSGLSEIMQNTSLDSPKHDVMKTNIETFKLKHNGKMFFNDSVRYIEIADFGIGHCKSAFSVNVDCDERSLYCCLSFFVPDQEDAKKILLATQLADWIGHKNPAAQSLSMWTQTVRQLLLVYLVEHDDKIQMKQNEETKQSDLLSSIMSAMDESQKEIINAKNKHNTARRYNDLTEIIGLKNTKHGDVNSFNLTMDFVKTFSCSVVNGYGVDKHNVDLSGLTKDDYFPRNLKYKEHFVENTCVQFSVLIHHCESMTKKQYETFSYDIGDWLESIMSHEEKKKQIFNVKLRKWSDLKDQFEGTNIPYDVMKDIITNIIFTSVFSCYKSLSMMQIEEKISMLDWFVLIEEHALSEEEKKNVFAKYDERFSSMAKQYIKADNSLLEHTETASLCKCPTAVLSLSTSSSFIYRAIHFQNIDQDDYNDFFIQLNDILNFIIHSPCFEDKSKKKHIAMCILGGLDYFINDDEKKTLKNILCSWCAKLEKKCSFISDFERDPEILRHECKDEMFVEPKVIRHFIRRLEVLICSL